MSLAAAKSPECPQATSGDLATLNLESSLDRSWQVLRRWPARRGTAERIVGEEQQRAQFLGDVSALDRLAELSSDMCEADPLFAGTHAVAAQIASMRHHFADANLHIAKAEALGAPKDVCDRSRLGLSQAVGEDLAAVLTARQAIADATPSLENLVPLGALLADLGEFEEANRIYLRAIDRYSDVSPFALASVCFQLGFLWGETVPVPDPGRAAQWYSHAIAYLPAFNHARVHLAEIHLKAGELHAAETLLLPVRFSGDPEVRWRLAQVLSAQERAGEADRERNAAHLAFEALLARHTLAFADHAAEFYLSIGSDPMRALDLARINLANRPTLRAFVLSHNAALAAGDTRLAANILARARSQWGHTKAFTVSAMAEPDASVALPPETAST